MVKSYHFQYALAAIFIGLGSWCVLDAHGVERLVLKPEFQDLSATSGLLLGCFGAQAILVGTLVALCKFKPITFLGFGLVGSVPFFVFNWYFVFVAKMFTPFMLIDFAGNIGILACGIIGFLLMRREESRAPGSALSGMS